MSFYVAFAFIYLDGAFDQSAVEVGRGGGHLALRALFKGLTVIRLLSALGFEPTTFLARAHAPHCLT